MHGVPGFSVSIGCVDPDGNVLVGVVYDPMFDECFVATRGGGATRSGEPIHVSTATRLRDSLAASGFPTDLRTENNNTREWTAFVSRCQGMARMGSCALDLSYAACGRFDLYWEYGPTVIDRSAGVLLVLEAGGTVTGIDGSPYHVVETRGTLASNGLVHSEAAQLLRSIRSETG